MKKPSRLEPTSALENTSRHNGLNLEERVKKYRSESEAEAEALTKDSTHNGILIGNEDGKVGR